MMEALIDPGEYAALAYCSYLNQASLGLIPRTSVEATRSADNTGVRVQVLRRQPDGSWLRIMDRAVVPRP